MATGALALSTTRDVTATQEIARLTRGDQEDRMRPSVIGTVTGVGSDNEGAYVSVDLHNAGGGAAVAIEVTAESRAGLDMEVTMLATIPANGSVATLVRSPNLVYRADKAIDPKPEDFRVRGRYRDRRARLVDEAIWDWRRTLGLQRRSPGETRPPQEGEEFVGVGKSRRAARRCASGRSAALAPRASRRASSRRRRAHVADAGRARG
jgi:hypothetical protein